MKKSALVLALIVVPASYALADSSASHAVNAMSERNLIIIFTGGSASITRPTQPRRGSSIRLGAVLMGLDVLPHQLGVRVHREMAAVRNARQVHALRGDVAKVGKV